MNEGNEAKIQALTCISSHENNLRVTHFYEEFSFFLVRSLFLKKSGFFGHKHKLNDNICTFFLEIEFSFAKKHSFYDHFSISHLYFGSVFKLDEVWPL